MKRIFAFILIVIVVLAAFTPCCIVDGCQDETTAISGQDHSKEDDCKGCSPFFACTACPGFTLTEKSISCLITFQYHPQYITVNFGNPATTYPDVPWQPPRYI